jgi:dethiobiotin synthetase
MSAFVITGTDTDVGKTVFAAALVRALSAAYWKPIQAGLAEETDSEKVARLAEIPRSRILAERYRLRTPASPHRAAELDGITIDVEDLVPPPTDGPLVIEGAGGVLVPLTRSVLSADVFARWALPVILCARTALGTINHSLLSIEALKARSVPIHGIAFIGEENKDSETTIAAMSGVRRLGRLPWLPALSGPALAQAFATNFDLQQFPVAS